MAAMTSSPRPPEPDDAIVDAEIVPAPGVPVTPPTPDYDEHGVPSLDYLRDKIEGRHATALGMQELAGGTEPVRSLEEQEAERAKKAAAKLEELRRSLGT